VYDLVVQDFFVLGFLVVELISLTCGNRVSLKAFRRRLEGILMSRFVRWLYRSSAGGLWIYQVKLFSKSDPLLQNDEYKSKGIKTDDS
jgi:hypothetical protein